MLSQALGCRVVPRAVREAATIAFDQDLAFTMQSKTCGLDLICLPCE